MPNTDTDAAADSAPQRLIGVEEELLLVDPRTMHPVPVALGILNDVSNARAQVMEPEVKQEQIEVVSPPLATYDEVLESIDHGRRSADDAARRFGARALALATGRFAGDPHPVSTERYDEMQERFGATFDDQLTCGFHVHVTITSREEGVAVLDRIRPWLPVLLALSANSPFWHGRDTQFASYRYQAWGRWPSAGPYDLFGSPDGYDATVAQLMDTGVPLDEGMIYFDARLSTHAPTVETRICDVCLRPEDATALAVLVRALVETAARGWRSGFEAPPVPVGVLRAASWRASRFGLETSLVHPETGTSTPAVVAVRALLAHVRRAFTSEAEADRVAMQLRRILARGNGSRAQRDTAGGTVRPSDMVTALAAETFRRQ